MRITGRIDPSFDFDKGVDFALREVFERFDVSLDESADDVESSLSAAAEARFPDFRQGFRRNPCFLCMML